jgi:hypothetical protein
MSDTQRCRITAARYARLGDKAVSVEARRSYRELERLWLQMAAITAKTALNDNMDLRLQIYALMDDVAVHRSLLRQEAH